MRRTMLNNEPCAKPSAMLRQNGLYAKQSMRLIVEGIFYRMRICCPWRDLPAIFGKPNTVRRAFNRWSATGIPRLIRRELCRRADCEWVFIDGSCIKTHQHAHGAASNDEAIGPSRGRKSSKSICRQMPAATRRFSSERRNIADVAIMPQLLKNIDLKPCEVLSGTKVTTVMLCVRCLVPPLAGTALSRAGWTLKAPTVL
ncbi:MAG: transposase [Eikenella sp.]|nr:transposase [Eikenella sp.]